MSDQPELYRAFGGVLEVVQDGPAARKVIEGLLAEGAIQPLKPVDPDKRYTDRGNGVSFIHSDVRRPWAAKVRLWVNQGWRTAWTVDTYEAQVLFAYEMPNGRVFFQEWAAFEGPDYMPRGSFHRVRTVNPNRPPAIWKHVDFDAER